MMYAVLPNCSFETFKENVFVGVVCLTVTMGFLSIIGCLLIMFTYVAYRPLRTKGRAMLFHLSVADLIIVLSHMVGLWNYRRFIDNPENITFSNNDALCVSQAAFTLFGTVASLLWSNAIGFFMLVLVVSRNEKVTKVFYIGSMVVCWAVPAVIVTANAASKYLGFHTLGTADCYIINVASNNSVRIQDYQLAETFSYEVWAYLTLLILPVLYMAVFYYTYYKMKNIPNMKNKDRRPPVEMKLLFVPLIFVLLRIWSVVMGIYAYFKLPDDKYMCQPISAVILLISTVGINGQGFANAILFCILTAPVRRRLRKTLQSAFRKYTPSSKHGEEARFIADTLCSTTVNDAKMSMTSSSRSYSSINNQETP